jgi:hypothetical protein
MAGAERAIAKIKEEMEEVGFRVLGLGSRV